MKVPKSLLQAIAAAVVISATASACTKDPDTSPDFRLFKKKDKVANHHNCPGCGMG